MFFKKHSFKVLTLLGLTLCSTSAFATTNEIEESTKTIYESSSTYTNIEYKIKYNYRIYYEGTEVDFKKGVLTYTDNSGNTSTYLPLDDLADLLGAEIQQFSEYDAKELNLDGTEIEIVSNKDKAVIVNQDGTTEVVEVKSANGTNIPIITVNGDTYLPIRFISEKLGYSVSYSHENPETNAKTIEIYKGNTAPNLVVQEKTYTPEYASGLLSEDNWKVVYTKAKIFGLSPVPGLYLPLLGQHHKPGTEDDLTVSIMYIPVFDINEDGYLNYNNNKYTYSEFLELAKETERNFLDYLNGNAEINLDNPLALLSGEEITLLIYYEELKDAFPDENASEIARLIHNGMYYMSDEFFDTSGYNLAYAYVYDTNWSFEKLYEAYNALYDAYYAQFN